MSHNGYVYKKLCWPINTSHILLVEEKSDSDTEKKPQHFLQLLSFRIIEKLKENAEQSSEREWK